MDDSDDSDRKALVRRGYDAASDQYRADGDDDAGERGPWIAALARRLPAGADAVVSGGPALFWCQRPM